MGVCCRVTSGGEQQLGHSREQLSLSSVDAGWDPVVLAAMDAHTGLGCFTSTREVLIT